MELAMMAVFENRDEYEAIRLGKYVPNPALKTAEARAKYWMDCWRVLKVSDKYSGAAAMQAMEARRRGRRAAGAAGGAASTAASVGDGVTAREAAAADGAATDAAATDGGAPSGTRADGLAAGKRQRPATFADRPLRTQSTLAELSRAARAKAFADEGAANTKALKVLADAARDRNIIATLSAPAIRDEPRFRDFLCKRAEELIAAHLAARDGLAAPGAAANNGGAHRTRPAPAGLSVDVAVREAGDAEVEREVSSAGAAGAAAGARGADSEGGVRGGGVGRRAAAPAALTIAAAAATGQAAAASVVGAAAGSRPPGGRSSAAAGAAAAASTPPLTAPRPALLPWPALDGGHPPMSPSLPPVDFAWPPVAPRPPPRPRRPEPVPAPAVLYGQAERPRAAVAAGSATTADPHAFRRSAITAEGAATTTAPDVLASAAMSVTTAATGGRSAAALLSVGRRAQVTRRLQYATQRSCKGKGPKRAALYVSPSPSVSASEDPDADDGVGIVRDEDGEFEGLIGDVKELEEEQDDEDLYL